MDAPNVDDPISCPPVSTPDKNDSDSGDSSYGTPPSSSPEESTNINSPNLFLRLKTNLALPASIGSFFSSPTSQETIVQAQKDTSIQTQTQASEEGVYDSSKCEDGIGATPRDRDRLVRRSLSGVKRILSDIKTRSRGSSLSNSSISNTSPTFPAQTQTQTPVLSSSSTLSSFFSGNVTTSSASGSSDGTLVSPSSSENTYNKSSGSGFREHSCAWWKEDELPVDEEHLREVREGKKPQKALDYDTLIADITNNLVPSEESITPQDEQEEWYGLECTLELSRRESQLSQVHQVVGEYSKSYQSFSTLHPSDSNSNSHYQYVQWRRWRAYIDNQERELRKMKVVEFLTRSEEMAWVYVEERRMREWVAVHLEEYGEDLGLEYAKKYYRAVVESRPDPYVPPQKHGLAWRLKSSRSVASLRELHPGP
ncbi:hypothetical protein JAAARDRAFT_188281 [Jaapia argillacea MUCL 33604]|uniref:Uncharacterized protein n=1 Tax=Jaapia argillacea MUCL 33604 TaxID=933084 RepID=A0A067QD82_9AGAM|nr:hypothetical protein JAAARDRAFT_188281 [Jaapia argillacea MUCL 33604]